MLPPCFYIAGLIGLGASYLATIAQLVMACWPRPRLRHALTEYHSRYKRAKRGALIYWTVETAGAMAIYSQLLSCSASEVHAMVEGAMRHGTEMRLGSNAVDSHGASFIGFGITRLLGFDLIARFKQINKMKLYLPGRGQLDTYPLLAPALTRPIRWDVIESNYDSMVKYATAIRRVGS